ncbi:MAG: DUF262 domain-containing protein [Chitinophagaceae bacterium]|nr:DUF262 domain-containing protein [Chitinophagaceae bacterium]
MPPKTSMNNQRITISTNSENDMLEPVQLINKNLEALLSPEYNLQIPDYQRTYSWEEKHVVRMLDDIQNFAGNTYHMGSIILHKRINEKGELIYDVVDGQQRLVTLSLLLLHLGLNDFPFLEQKFESEIAQNYLAHNKWLIENIVAQKQESYNNENILNNLHFAVLILNADSLDLAYTFFTSENGKGKPLSDFDLLKSHHLRFILIPQQAEHLAGRWDNMILESNNDDSTKPLSRTFEIYLFRLRQWMRKRRWDENKKRKVKNEFEASPFMPDIPPFGEQFHFYESIHGGVHFFGFAEHYMQCFNEFNRTLPYELLNKHLNWEKHWWYRDIIEAFLFAYYIKFGLPYLNEACLLITRVISQHRYESSRAYLSSVTGYAGDSEIILMIEQSTSPTFFLAEILLICRKMPSIPAELDGTRYRYNSAILNINKILVNDSINPEILKVFNEQK